MVVTLSIFSNSVRLQSAFSSHHQQGGSFQVHQQTAGKGNAWNAEKMVSVLDEIALFCHFLIHFNLTKVYILLFNSCKKSYKNLHTLLKQQVAEVCTLLCSPCML